MLRERGPIDAATVRALFTNRMQVLRDYRRQVIRPVFREIRNRERAPTTALRTPHLLIRNAALLDEHSHQELRELLARHESLRVVLSFRDRLLRLWNETSSSHARALTQLRELCREAGASGIPALRDFAERVSSYGPRMQT
jgi:stearoyl-CoA desaturase (delta-9 desaturase)